MFRLRFSEVEAVVGTMHGVPHGSTAVVSRFRYFQRLRFPGGTNTGRGVPAAYGLDQLMQVLVAFELAEAGLAPARIVRAVGTNWLQVRTAVLLGWQAAVGRTPWREREILVMEPSLLADSVSPDDVALPVEDPFVPVPAFALGGWSEGVDGPPRLLLVDPGRLVASLRDVVPKLTIHTLDELDEALERYGRGE